MTSAQAKKKYGIPAPKNEGKYMVLWEVPDDIEKAFAHVKFSQLGTIGFPKKIYCNRDAKIPLEKALRNIMARGLTREMKSWDGCFIVRYMRNYDEYSIHSWGAAVDNNSFENLQGKKPKLSAAYVACWKDAGWDWGGDWGGKDVDGMHFQLK